MATALTLTIGIEKKSYADNLSQHYADVKRRLRTTPPIKNKLREVLADKAERDRQFIERRRARYADWLLKKKAHTHPLTGEQMYLSEGSGALYLWERREGIARAAQQRESRLKGVPSFPFFHMLEAIDVILLECLVTWEAIEDTDIRDVHTRAARAMIYALMLKFYETYTAAGKVLGVDRGTVRKIHLQFEKLVGANPTFLRAVSCVRHK
jgi:hypothetical protein